MKRCLGVKHLLVMLSVVVAAENALAQNANFSQMNGLQPIATSTPAENGTFMSELYKNELSERNIKKWN